MNQTTSNYPAKQRYWGDIAKDYEQWRLASPIRRFVWGREFRLLEGIMRQLVGEHSTILDAPTGTGRFLPLFKNLGFEATGIDISIDMLKVQTRAPGATIPLAQADCEYLPFRDCAFDYVISLRFLGHLPPAIRVRVLQEFKRISSKGIVVGFPVLNSFTKLKFDLGNLRYQLANGKTRPWWPASPQSLSKELDIAGLKISQETKLLGPFSQIAFLHLTPEDACRLPSKTSDRQAHLASA